MQKVRNNFQTYLLEVYKKFENLRGTINYNPYILDINKTSNLK